jgi:hypothetical protein
MPINESFFTKASFIGWFNIIQLSRREFGVSMFIAEFLFAISTVIYFRMIRVKHLTRLVSHLVKKDLPQGAPIPLH